MEQQSLTWTLNRGGGQAMHEELRNMHMKWVTNIHLIRQEKWMEMEKIYKSRKSHAASMMTDII